MSTGSRPDEAVQRMRGAYTSLAALLVRQEGTDPEVMTARAELALACAEAGELEDAVFQADQLVGDAERSTGPSSDRSGEMRALRARIWQIAGAPGPPDA
ncbi:MAG: hypothetical protein Q4G40_00795 [Brachybacterium sp.]|nr:hypothetical protein [Brachybacterium sp.]